ncbi:MAG: hypothetical protein IGS23_20285 [Rivularia sp. T60_A2020_040]|nr:hypothetical protein [Rivularia sp. T60_A2020_040]
MNAQKKAYAAPSLIVHGTVVTITQQGGPPVRVDVPQGTPINGDINNIVS